jgi:hypothetical protein
VTAWASGAELRGCTHQVQVLLGDHLQLGQPALVLLGEVGDDLPLTVLGEDEIILTLNILNILECLMFIMLNILMTICLIKEAHQETFTHLFSGYVEVGLEGECCLQAEGRSRNTHEALYGNRWR